MLSNQFQMCEATLMPGYRSGVWNNRLWSVYRHHYKKLTYSDVCQDIWNLTLKIKRKKNGIRRCRSYNGLFEHNCSSSCVNTLFIPIWVSLSQVCVYYCHCCFNVKIILFHSYHHIILSGLLYFSFTLVNPTAERRLLIVFLMFVLKKIDHADVRQHGLL